MCRFRPTPRDEEGRVSHICTYPWEKIYGVGLGSAQRGIVLNTLSMAFSAPVYRVKRTGPLLEKPGNGGLKWLESTPKTYLPSNDGSASEGLGGLTAKSDGVKQDDKRLFPRCESGSRAVGLIRAKSPADRMAKFKPVPRIPQECRGRVDLSNSINGRAPLKVPSDGEIKAEGVPFESGRGHDR